MSDNDIDKIPKLARMWETLDEEEQAMIIDLSLRRLKADSGSPIFSLDQLRGADPRTDESPFIKTVYDKFGQRAAPPGGDGARA